MNCFFLHTLKKIRAKRRKLTKVKKISNHGNAIKSELKPSQLVQNMFKVITMAEKNK